MVLDFTNEWLRTADSVLITLPLGIRNGPRGAPKNMALSSLARGLTLAITFAAPELARDAARMYSTAFSFAHSEDMDRPGFSMDETAPFYDIAVIQNAVQCNEAVIPPDAWRGGGGITLRVPNVSALKAC